MYIFYTQNVFCLSLCSTIFLNTSRAVYVCVYIYIYIHTHVSCVCVCESPHSSVHTYHISVCVYMSLHPRTYGSMQVCIYLSIYLSIYLPPPPPPARPFTLVAFEAQLRSCASGSTGGQATNQAAAGDTSFLCGLRGRYPS